jgi:nicotinamidase-related amidase
MGEHAVVPPPPPLIDKKWGEPKMTSRLAILVKRVAELYAAGLQACHCVEEFTLRRIRPLGYREKLAYDCLQLIDPSREHAAGKMFNLYFYY